MTRLHFKLVDEVADLWASRNSMMATMRAQDEYLYWAQISRMPVRFLIKTLPADRQGVYEDLIKEGDDMPKARFKVVGRKDGELFIKSFRTDFGEIEARKFYDTLDQGAIFRRIKKRYVLTWGIMPNLSDLPEALIPFYEEEKKIAREYFDSKWSYDDHNERASERGEPPRTATEWHEHWQETDSSCGFYYEDGQWVMHNWEDQERIRIVNGNIVSVEEV